jgi:argininosuccinate synthase
MSLYDLKLATYGDEDEFDQSQALGFIQIYSMPAMVAARVRREAGKGE